MHRDGTVLPLKADPYAFAAELRPKTASLTARPGKTDWGDDAHRAHWANIDPRRAPMSIYEVHPGSWQRDAQDWFLDWDSMAARLIRLRSLASSRNWTPRSPGLSA